MADGKKKGKAIHKTESPYSKPQVPKLEQPHHDVVVDLLVTFLSPLKVATSTAKRRKAMKHRKRKRSKVAVALLPSDAHTQHVLKDVPTTPSSISLRKQLLLGFNEVTRYLEDVSTISKPPSTQHVAEGNAATAKRSQVAAIFLLRPLDDLIYTHLPTLCCTASAANPELPATRLVILDPSSEKQITAAIGNAPSLSVLAVFGDGEDVHGREALVNYVREHVRPVEVPWLKEVMAGKWLGTKIST